MLPVRGVDHGRVRGSFAQVVRNRGRMTVARFTDTRSLTIAVFKLERVRAVLSWQLQSADDVGVRCGLPTSIVAASLRELRRRGEAEFVQINPDTFRWRIPSEKRSRASDDPPSTSRTTQGETAAFRRHPAS